MANLFDSNAESIDMLGPDFIANNLDKILNLLAQYTKPLMICPLPLYSASSPDTDPAALGDHVITSFLQTL